MLSRAAIGRQAQRAARRSWQQQTRGLAEPASGSFQYQTGEANGVKFASRDIPGPVASLAIVAKAGTRFEPIPGLAEGLDRIAFKNTERRTTLRIQRESELLGSVLQSYHSRENVVVGAKFFQDDLPYFVELLAEVATMTKYQPHIFHEEIYPMMSLHQKSYLANTTEMAINSAHGLAFHRGLGVPLFPASSTPMKKYLDADSLSEYAASAYSQPNFALVANGVDNGELSKWVSEMFTDVPAQPAYQIKTEQSKYYGGEERIAHASGNSLVIALPGSSSPTGPFYKPEVAVLAALLGGQSSIKWSPGFSLLANATQSAPHMFIDTKSSIYSDAGLLTITMVGSASDIKNNAGKVVEALKSVAQGVDKETFTKAKALAKFKELQYGQETQAAIELTGAGLVHGGKAYQIDEVAKSVEGVTAEKVQQIAKEALENKASVSAVGDLYMLPYAEEIGLKV
ncbi:ubiquinol-cytochrome c reductase core subunit 1 [Vermiconidia calcicola]|uniref:Ubiquinol-cytochrome c reductase core subunit 1 n=1 Tax=Vermiconidia calcicola TaxID=1690605 RepID=A0ACC3MYI2_9PEZI|nr:ubiquinol-cytochrome c reductase core subunit 1 [Vermiconidia calcicola]